MIMNSRTPLVSWRGVLAVAFSLFLGACDGDTSSQSDVGDDIDSGAEQTGGAASEAPEQDSEASEETASEGSTDQAAQQDTRKEATSQGGVVDSLKPLPVDELLIVDRLQDLFELEVRDIQPIPGKEPSPFYNSARFLFEDHQGFGIGIQVWAIVNDDDAEARFTELRSQHLNVEETDIGISGGDEHFSSNRGSIETIVSWTNKEQPRIVALSCDTSLCDNDEDFAELFNQISERLKVTYR